MYCQGILRVSGQRILKKMTNDGNIMRIHVIILLKIFGHEADQKEGRSKDGE